MLEARQIFKIYKKYKTPQNVIFHMVRVAEFAEDLCDKFIKKGYKIDKDAIIQAALLHDIVRTTRKNHAAAAEKILRSKKQPKVATLIGKHCVHKINELSTLEEKILFYADKRIKGTKKVPLKKRFNFKIDDKVFDLEKEIKKLSSRRSSCCNNS